MDNLDYDKNTEKKDFYFSNSDSSKTDTVQNKNVKPKNDKKPAKKKPKKTGAGSTYLFFIIVIVISVAISIYAIFCLNDVLAITKTKSVVTISYSENIKTTDEVIDMLSDNGLVKCKNFCKLFMNLRNKVMKSSAIEGPFDAGVYYLNGKMGLEGMMLALKGTQNTTETVTLTFPEGYTLPEIINRLSENDVCDRSALISVIQTTDFNLDLVKDLKASDSVPYRLEGYMFPDTYEFYIDESASSVARKFLENGQNRFTEKYKARAEELGLTTYEVMTIASIIQMEAANEDQMKTISAIIHNRLNDSANFPYLGCQSTSDYITNKVAPALSSTSSHTSQYYLDYYNTNNMVNGLPAGPICNPGAAAIKAALYPNNSKAKYFFHDDEGTMYTAKTLQEFKDKIDEYAPYLNY